jgi:hypothetical protein
MSQSAGTVVEFKPVPDPIHVAMSKVMAEIRAIEKSNRNQQQGYAFRGIDDVFNALQPILVAHGVWYTPEAVENDHEWRQTKSGGWQHSTILKIRYRFYGPAGDSITMETIGESADSADKSTQQAMSQALKSGLLQTFCIRTKESADNEPDRKSPQAGGPARSRPKSQPKPARADEADKETGEIPEPPNVSAAIEKLDQEGRKELNEKLAKANMKLGELSPAASKQVLKWAEELLAKQDAGAPF